MITIKIILSATVCLYFNTVGVKLPHLRAISKAQSIHSIFCMKWVRNDFYHAIKLLNAHDESADDESSL